MAGTGRYTLHSVDRWRSFSAAAAITSAATGTYVEILQHKSHSLPWAAVGCALAGLLGAFFVAGFHKRFRIHWLGNINEVPVWMAAPAALVLGGWLLDFRHGLVLNHQYAHYSAFAVGVLLGLIRNGWEAEWKIQIPTMLPKITSPPATNRPLTKLKKTTTHDLPALIRDIVIALNNKYDMTERQKKFVEANLLAAVASLIAAGRLDKAAQLCRKVPSNWIRFETSLEGLDLDDGLRLAMACFRINDWGTALRIMDWALANFSGPDLEKRVFTAATMVAEQMSILDDAFDAKVVALQLSPKLRQALKTLPGAH